MNVAILGASDNPSRYSYKVFELLLKKGHMVFPVHPELKEILGTPVFANISAIKETIHTLTLYVRPEISQQQTDQIIQLNPKRVIFNPGTENPTLLKTLTQKGIQCEEACSLVLLQTDQF